MVDGHTDAPADDGYTILGKLTANLGKLFFIFASIFINVVVQSWFLVKLWQWYIGSYFNLPQLDMVHAFGLSVFVSFLTHVVKLPNSNDEKMTTKRLFNTFCFSLSIRSLAFAVAWIGTFFL